MKNPKLALVFTCVLGIASGANATQFWSLGNQPITGIFTTGDWTAPNGQKYLGFSCAGKRYFVSDPTEKAVVLELYSLGVNVAVSWDDAGEKLNPGDGIMYRANRINTTGY